MTPSGWAISPLRRDTARPYGVEDADLDRSQHLPHPRTRLGEDLFRTRQAARAEGRARSARADGRRWSSPAASPRLREAEILRRQPAVDVVVGPQSYHRLPELLREARVRPGLVDTEFPAEDKFSRLPATPPDAIRKRGVSAFVTVQEGCDKFCSFCVVPYTRGAEASRPVAAILDEIARLASAGVREVTLLGQNVNAYHGVDDKGHPTGLAGLIRAAAAVPGICRVRYTTSHPDDMSEDLIAGPPRHSGARALSPSARSVRLGHCPEIDEPPPSRRRLSRHCRARARRAPGHRLLFRLHRRLSRRNRRRLRSDARSRPGGGVRLGLRI